MEIEKVGQIYTSIEYDWEIIEVTPNSVSTKLLKTTRTQYNIGLIEKFSLGTFANRYRLLKDVGNKNSISQPVAQTTKQQKESEEDRTKRFFFGKTF